MNPSCAADSLRAMAKCCAPSMNGGPGLARSQQVMTPPPLHFSSPHACPELSWPSPY